MALASDYTEYFRLATDTWTTTNQNIPYLARWMQRVCKLWTLSILARSRQWFISVRAMAYPLPHVYVCFAQMLMFSHVSIPSLGVPPHPAIGFLSRESFESYKSRPRRDSWNTIGWVNAIGVQCFQIWHIYQAYLDMHRGFRTTCGGTNSIETPLSLSTYGISALFDCESVYLLLVQI